MPTAAVPRTALPREVWVLCAVAFSVALGFGVVAPAIPLLARSFDVSDFAASAVISAFAFMRFASALGTGRLIDRIGERVVLATGIGVVAVSSALAGAAPTYVLLVVLRGIGGVGSAMFSISALSVLVRSVEPGMRGRATSRWNGSFLLGGVLGPVFGGLVTDQSARTPFFLYAGTLAVAGTIGLLALPRHLRVEQQDAHAPPEATTTFGTAWRSRPYRTALAGACAQQWASFGVRSALIPLFVTAAAARGGLGLEPRWVGLGLGVSAAAQGVVLVPAGRVADLRGRKPLMVVGLAALAAAMVLLAAADGLPGYLASMVVFGPATAMLSVAPASMVADVVAGRGGTAYAGFSMAGDAGQVVGPLVAGAISRELGYSSAFLVTAGLLVLPLLYSLASPETRSASRPREPGTAAS